MTELEPIKKELLKLVFLSFRRFRFRLTCYNLVFSDFANVLGQSGENKKFPATMALLAIPWCFGAIDKRDPNPGKREVI